MTDSVIAAMKEKHEEEDGKAEVNAAIRSLNSPKNT
jgi:hypothetical protein